LIPRSPTGSVFRRLRKTASSVGISLGGQGNYDAEQEEIGDEELGEEDEGKKANGTRVWYRCVKTGDGS
jgi:chloride channel 3/4/5